MRRVGPQVVGLVFRFGAAIGVAAALTAAAVVAATLTPAKAEDAPKVESAYAQVNGVEIHYLVAGEGSPVILLHGFAQTSHMWLPLIPELAKTHLVIAPDLRGFGFRNFPQDAEDFADFAKTKLTMPMLVLTGEKASGDFLIEQGKMVDDHVEGVVIKGSGHWLMDEAPDQVIPKLVAFFAN